MAFGDITKQAIDRQLSIIQADCADAQSFPGCDDLTVNAAKELLIHVTQLAEIRLLNPAVVKQVV